MSHPRFAPQEPNASTPVPGAVGPYPPYQAPRPMPVYRPWAGEYHRAAVTARKVDKRLMPRPFTAWRPLWELLVDVVLLIPVLIITVVLFAFWELATPVDNFDDYLANLGDATDPVGLTVSLLSVSILGFVPFLGASLGGGRSTRFLWSVVGRIRWRIVWISAGVTTGLTVLNLLLGYVLFADEGQGFSPVLDQRMILMIVIAVLLVPVQATAEELVFRGAIPQIVGSWIKKPWIPYGVGVPLFVAGHTYSWQGLIGIAIFGVCAAYLTYKTNGLEAAMGMHTMNNMLLFIAGALTGENALEENIPLLDAVISSIFTIVITLVVLRCLRATVAEASAARQAVARQIGAYNGGYVYDPRYAHPR